MNLVLTYTEARYERGPQKNLEFIYKGCVFILTCVNFSHLQSTLHFVHYTSQDFLSTAQNSFWTCWFWCLFVFLLFLFHLLHIGKKCFPLRTFFHQGNKKSHSGGVGVNREGGAQGSYCFWSKSAEHSVRCGQVCS